MKKWIKSKPFFILDVHMCPLRVANLINKLVLVHRFVYLICKFLRKHSLYFKLKMYKQLFNVAKKYHIGPMFWTSQHIYTIKNYKGE